MAARDETKPLVAGRPAAALRAFCHYLHLVLVFYALLGWLIPSRPWLIAHLIYMPALIAVWLANKGVCPLNNVEGWLTTGRWRNEHNKEEGSFIVTIVERYLGLTPTQRQMDAITYALMGLVWMLSWMHLSAL
jgi:hypothetical protein